MALFTIDEVNDPERLHLENRFDDVINGLWCEEEKERLFRMKPEVLENISNAELKERLDHFDEVCSNIELVEKYMTITLTDTMVEAEDNGKTDLEEWLLSATGDLYDLFKNMNKCLNETGRLLPLQDDELDIMLFKKCADLKLKELHYNGIFRYQLKTPHFSFTQNENTSSNEDHSNIWDCSCGSNCIRIFEQNKDENNCVRNGRQHNCNILHNITTNKFSSEIDGCNDSYDEYFYDDLSCISCQDTPLEPDEEEYFLFPQKQVGNYKDLNPIDIIQIKGYLHRLKYINIYRNFYNNLNTKPFLSNMSPKVEWSRLVHMFQNHDWSETFASIYLFGRHLDLDVSNRKKSAKFCAPYTRTKIYKEYIHEFSQLLEEKSTWHRIILDFILHVKLPLLESVRRELLGTIGFPTLFWLKNNLTESMLEGIEEQLKENPVDVIEDEFENTLEEIRRFKCYLQSRANKNEAILNGIPT